MAKDDHPDTPFARPAVRQKVKRALERIGVIDVGSNSVRMVVFDGAARSPAYFFNEKILCALGAGVAETGRLNPHGRARALTALKRFKLLARGMNAPLTGVATAAVREAEDGTAFIREVENATGITLKVASGKEEARLSAQGVLLGWPDASGLVCDLGGASMELAEIGKNRIGRRVSTPLGPLKLAALADDGARAREVAKTLKALRGKFAKQYSTIFLVGGSWRAIARLDMERRDYPLKVLHEYEMTPAQVMETAEWIGSHAVPELQALTGSSAARMNLVPNAAIALRGLLAEFAPDRIAVSSYGIREGILFEQLPDELRRRDPLLEACLHMEAAAARVPGFGKVLYAFLKPAFPDLPAEKLRLMRAACTLHDVTWRAHPDYRAEVCFDNSTRANLGGLDHAGRVFLGTALLHRYKGTRSRGAFDQVIGLLPEEDQKLAETIGKAMRFGAMLSGSATRNMGELEYDRAGGRLDLVLPAKLADLYGEILHDRFESFGRALGCETRVRTG